MDRDFTYYDLLGVSSNASQDEITVAYRAVIRHMHPDVNKAPNAQQLTALFNRAYEVLRDPGSRGKYDRGLTKSQPKESPRKHSPRSGGFALSERACLALDRADERGLTYEWNGACLTFSVPGQGRSYLYSNADIERFARQNDL